MKISCPACSAKYSIADDKLAGRLAKIRCRKCETTIVIDGKVNPPAVRSGDADAQPQGSVLPAVASGPTEYSIDFGENDQRSMLLDQLVAAYNDGQVTADTFVWAEGFDDWKPLGEVDEIVEALHNAAGAAPAEPPAPAPEFTASSPWEAPARLGSAPRAATRPQGADLFGRIEHVGSEEDVTTSAPEDPPPHAQATGARNESSVLFSLSALTSAAATSRQARPASSPGGRDDSGLIDLKALTEAAARSDAVQAQAPIGMPLMAPPLFSGAGPLGGAIPTPIGGSAFDARPQSKNRMGLFIGGGLVVAALVVAAAIVTRPVPPPPAPPPQVAAAAPVVPVPVPVPTVDEKAKAEEEAKKAAEAEAKAKEEEAKKPAATRRWRPRPKTDDSTPVTATKPGGDAPKEKKPQPKASPCGCAPSDLQCHMRCSAGG